MAQVLYYVANPYNESGYDKVGEETTSYVPAAGEVIVINGEPYTVLPDRSRVAGTDEFHIYVKPYNGVDEYYLPVAAPQKY